MVLVAIIGILAAFAIPAYQDYISKTQVTRVVGELAAAKTGVDAALFAGRQPVLGSDVADDTKEGIGLTTAVSDAITANDNTIRSNLIKELTLTNGGGTDVSIAATLGRNANKDIHDALVTQARDENGVWTCKVSPESAKGFKSKFIPTGCVNGK